MWGLRPKVVHWLYVAIIWPSISYASIAWWPGRQTASAKKRLSRIQRCACLEITGAICNTPTVAVMVLTGLPPLDLVIQCEARSAVYRLWSLGCWSYLHLSQGHSSILMRLQNSMGVNVMRPVFNLEPKYRVTVLTREECTRLPGTPPAVKGLIWFTVGSRTMEGTGHSVGRRLSISV
jgi:hypothetical protein